MAGVCQWQVQFPARIEISIYVVTSRTIRGERAVSIGRIVAGAAGD
jgi:hypothetical protein